MKKLLILLTAIFTTNAITVDAILDSVEANESANTTKMVMEQRVTKSNGKVSISVLESYSTANDGKKSIMVYQKPKRIKGMKILSLNDGSDIWLFSPRTKRTRKLASSQKKGSVNGSDFSYEDMSTSDKENEYNSKLIKEESINKSPCYAVELTAKDVDEQTYSKIVMWIDKEKWIPIKTTFYDEYNELWKELTMTNLKKVGKYWSADYIKMENIQKGSNTVMKTISVEYDIELKKGLFSTRNLAR